MENMAATGHKVLLYSDGGCLNQVGDVYTDDFCYVAPSNVSNQKLDPAVSISRADRDQRR
jgi:hypothetical protein